MNPEQDMVRVGLSRFLAARYSLDSSRAAAKTDPGWQPEIWRAFAEELGILGATLPESAGGSGGRGTEAMVISEELGRALVIEPFIDTVIVAGGLLARAGGKAATAVLAQVAAGSAIVALAATDADSGDRWDGLSTTAVCDGDDWLISGSKIVVIAAPLATHLLITARAADHDALFLTEFDATAPPGGLTVHAYRTIDDRRAADLVFDDVRLPAEALLQADAAPSLARARDEGAAAVCSEAVGAMRRVLADTVEYTKHRQQFGQPIGSFQVLAHRMVDMYMELQQAVSAVYLAVLNLDEEPDVRARAVSAAKATVGRAARFIGQNAVQLHGGMGMTDELAVGHGFKRLTVIEQQFGGVAQHLRRVAGLTRARS